MEKTTNKFKDIISDENLEIITSILSQIDNPRKIDFIETVSNIIYLHEKKFDTMDNKTKIDALVILALVFDVLLDKEINPYSAKLIEKAIRAFNNNIYGGAHI